MSDSEVNLFDKQEYNTFHDRTTQKSNHAGFIPNKGQCAWAAVGFMIGFIPVVIALIVVTQTASNPTEEDNRGKVTSSGFRLDCSQGNRYGSLTPPDLPEYQERKKAFNNGKLCGKNYSSPKLCMSLPEMVNFLVQKSQDGRLAEDGNSMLLSTGDTCTDDGVSAKFKPKYTRKEVRMLTDQEWETYANAIWAMKRTYPGRGDDNSDSDFTNDISEYDIFVLLHNKKNAPYAHNGTAFIVWHREFLSRFERAMRSHESNVSIPYWDSSLDDGLPSPSKSVIWSEHLFGNNYQEVTTGKFRHFNMTQSCWCLGETLHRHVLLQHPSDGCLFNQNKFCDLKVKNTYRNFTFGIGDHKADTSLERYHDYVHIYVGGHMGVVPCAPNDPMFWLHHSFIDYLLEDFRQSQDVYSRSFDYPEDPHPGDVNKSGHKPYHLMIPFEPLVNIDGLSDSYTNYMYSYAPSPSQIVCTTHTDCESKYLWCDIARNKCVSKVDKDCTGLEDVACYCPGLNTTPVCDNGHCLCRRLK